MERDRDFLKCQFICGKVQRPGQLSAPPSDEQEFDRQERSEYGAGRKWQFINDYIVKYKRHMVQGGESSTWSFLTFPKCIPISVKCGVSFFQRQMSMPLHPSHREQPWAPSFRFRS
jgi:hypothetical protein